jgi:hypothetical protein
MDISQNNSIDLLYLTNPHLKIKYNKIDDNSIDSDELKFYRKRILQDTKGYLRGKKMTEQIDACFNQYIINLISHYKFTDKKKSIQEEYDTLKESKKKPKIRNMKMEEENKLMMKIHTRKKKTIKDFIPIVVKERRKKKLIMPKKKNINLRDPKYR